MSENKSLATIIGEGVGEASMQWSSIPSGVYEDAEASALVDRLMEEVPYAALDHLTKQVGIGNVKKGFRAEGDAMREILAEATQFGTAHGLPEEFWKARYHDYVSKRLLLVISELVEAFEEIRSGHPVTEMYFVDGKPEGAPVEAVDAVIRLLDFFDEFHIDLSQVFMVKDAYNATRPFMHGRKF